MAPLTLLDGSWHGTLAMIRDITDLVKAEEELRERAALLERSNADLERFRRAGYTEGDSGLMTLGGTRPRPCTVACWPC